MDHPGLYECLSGARFLMACACFVSLNQLGVERRAVLDLHLIKGSGQRFKGGFRLSPLLPHHRLVLAVLDMQNTGAKRTF